MKYATACDLLTIPSPDVHVADMTFPLFRVRLSRLRSCLKNCCSSARSHGESPMTQSRLELDLCNERKIFHEKDASYVLIPRKPSVTFSGIRVCVCAHISICVYVRHNILLFMRPLLFFVLRRETGNKERTVD